MAKNTYQRIEQYIATYLKESKCLNEENTKSYIEIVEGVNDLIHKNEKDSDTFSPADNTIIAYLNRAANQDDDSGVRSAGKKAGYFYAEVNVSEAGSEIDDSSENNHISKSTVRTKKRANSSPLLEKDLYPLMKHWLIGTGYFAEDVSTGKKNGKWGNPDLLGVKITELYGATEIELVSCEVKRNLDDWEKSIFEAISHKRFANKSWFCFLTGESEVLPKNMLYYAEKYRVGILQIKLSIDKQTKLKKDGNSTAKEFLQDIVIHFPALPDLVALSEQKDILDKLEVELTKTAQFTKSA